MKTDAQIQKDVMEEIRWQPFLNSSEIGVAVKNGVVTLSGTVDVYSKKKSAEAAAKRVKDVKAVAIDIEVTPAFSYKRNDTQIAEAVVNALRWNSQVPDEKIKTKVDDGFVTLEGQLDWAYQRTAAYDSVKDLLGVKGVINNLTLVSRIKPSEVKQKITAAFERAASLDAEKIQVQTSGSKVILKGTVRSWAEKDDATAAAYAAPGVNEVENDLVISSEVEVY